MIYRNQNRNLQPPRQQQHIHSSTLVINTALAHRRNCLEASHLINRQNKQSREKSPIYINDIGQENIKPLFENNHLSQKTSLNSSLQLKKQARKKTGSIGKIKRNNENQLLESKITFKQKQNYQTKTLENNLSNISFSKNSKSIDRYQNYPYEKNTFSIDKPNKTQKQSTNQSLGIYKRLYDQNKILNQVLKLKMYQGQNQKHTNNYPLNIVNSSPSQYNFLYSTNSSGQKSSNYPYQICKISDSNNDNFYSKYIVNHNQRNNSVNQKPLQKSTMDIKNLQHLDNKYQNLLSQYDKKRNFVKEEIQAMKQKSTLLSFEKYQQNLVRPYNDKIKEYQNGQTKSNSNQTSKISNKYHSSSNSLNQSTLKTQNSIQSRFQNPHYPSTKQLSFQHQSLRPLSSNSGYNIKSNVQQTSKQNQIDKKFKQYQQKFEKYKSLQKRNPSLNTKEKENQQSKMILKSNKNKEFQKYYQNQRKYIENKSKIQQLSENKGKQNTQAEKKRIEETSSKKGKKQSMSLFVQLLMKQIQKDAQLISIKQSFRKQSLSQIQTILKNQYSLSVDIQKLKISIQQYNPFAQPPQPQLSNQALAKSYYTTYQLTQNYWTNLVKNRFQRSQLQQIFNQLNFQNKPQIPLASFTRQISFHMNKTLKSRDTYLIYQRLCPLNKNNFIKQLSKN